MTRIWKISVACDQQEKVASQPSATWHCWSGADCELLCADRIGATDYVLLSVSADSAEACENELWGQVSDGAFENYRVSSVEEVLDV